MAQLIRTQHYTSLSIKSMRSFSISNIMENLDHFNFEALTGVALSMFLNLVFIFQNKVYC